jgi:hypothetical protein
MPEQLEDKLTARATYKAARNVGLGMFDSALYFALPIAVENFAKASKEIMTPIIQSIQVDKKARTYHVVEEKSTFGNHMAEVYANILELKGYKRI